MMATKGGTTARRLLTTAAMRPRPSSMPSPASRGMLLETEWVYPSSWDNNNNNNSDSIAKNNGFAVILHGLMGNTRNVKSLARSMSDSLQIPSLLMDLRGHGKTYLSSSSSSFATSSPLEQLESSNATRTKNKVTLQDCVWDVHRTLSHHVPELSLSSSRNDTDDDDHKNPDNNNNNNNKKPMSWTLMGHSLGGRIAMLYSITPEISSLQQRPSNLWLLDTVPGGLHPSVEKVIDVALQLENGTNNGTNDTTIPPWKSRNQLTTHLVEQHGIELATAQWLATSYDLKLGTFQFDLQVAQDLIADFAHVDFMSWMERGIQQQQHGGGTTMRIDLVRGGANRAWEQHPRHHHRNNNRVSSASTIPSTLERLASWQVEHRHAFGFHTLPTAGHWVHIDDRKGLLAAIESVHVSSNKSTT